MNVENSSCSGLTFSVANCTFGFLCPMRRFSDRMASLGCTAFERTRSEISRFKAISSLQQGHQLLQGSKHPEDLQQATECIHQLTSSRTSLSLFAHLERRSKRTSLPCSEPWYLQGTGGGELVGTRGYLLLHQALWSRMTTSEDL